MLLDVAGSAKFVGCPVDNEHWSRCEATRKRFCLWNVCRHRSSRFCRSLRQAQRGSGKP